MKAAFIDFQPLSPSPPLILLLQKRMGESAVRSVNLARHMGFSKPSISHAVGVLREGGFLTMDKVERNTEYAMEQM